MPARFIAARFALCLSVGCGVRARAADSAEKPTEPAQKLDPVIVTAPRVPLVKLELGYRLRSARFGAAAVADGRYIYVIGGGNSSDTPLTEIERFDPRTGKSEHFADLAIGRRGHRAIVQHGKIYVLGGYNGVHWETTDFFENTVEVIDLATRAVSRAPNMPSARANFGCTLAGGRIYVIGGARLRQHAVVNTNTTDVFDLVTGKWAGGVPMPTPRMSLAVTVGNFIVVPGGFTGGRELADVETFALDDGQWRVLPKLVHPVSGNSLVFLDRYLFLFGAHELVTYELKTKRSDAFRFDYKDARETATVVLDGRIYVFGGMERNLTSDDSMAAFFQAAPTAVTIPRKEPGEASADWAAVSETEDLDKLHVMLNTRKDYVALDDVQVFELRSVVAR